jgi:hypothetical protein
MSRLFQLSLCDGAEVGQEEGHEEEKATNEQTFKREECVRALERFIGGGERRPTQVEVTVVVLESNGYGVRD